MTGTIASGGATSEQKILQANAFQQILLDVPLNDVICAGTAKATGKSFWIVLRIIRDAQIVKGDFHALVTREQLPGEFQQNKGQPKEES